MVIHTQFLTSDAVIAFQLLALPRTCPILYTEVNGFNLPTVQFLKVECVVSPLKTLPWQKKQKQPQTNQPTKQTKKNAG